MKDVEDKQIQTWNRVRSEPGPDLQIFQVRYDWVENPRNATTVKAVVLETADWVDVVALTPDEQIVLVEQNRFGIGRPSLELPAGGVQVNETAYEAAQRELREETGYTSADWTYLGWIAPNPAFHNNRCHHWLAKNVHQTHPVAFDAGEDLRVELCAPTQLRNEIKAGRMRSALDLVALSHVFHLWDSAQETVGIHAQIFSLNHGGHGVVDSEEFSDAIPSQQTSNTRTDPRDGKI